jgi:hypothetical protein
MKVPYERRVSLSLFFAVLVRVLRQKSMPAADGPIAK